MATKKTTSAKAAHKPKEKKTVEPVLSRYITTKSMEMLRSEIHFAEYNPRTITAEQMKELRKGIKKFGLVGGIVVNLRTGNTLVQGHQRITVMDGLQKYNPKTHENDYIIRLEATDIDEQSEQELAVLLNNPNAQGEWDYDRLALIVPKINIANAGLTSADLAMMGIGLEQNLAAVKTTSVPTITSAMMKGSAAPASKEETGWKKLPGDTPVDDIVKVLTGEETHEEALAAAEKARQAKIQHMKDVKAQANEQAQERAEQAAAYIMLSFDNMDNMQDFLARFNLPEQTQIVKGEELLSMLEEQE